MVVLAESFLQMIEYNSLSIAKNLPNPVCPITHRRYVDDTHDRFNNIEESGSFLEILNKQESRIKFTAEYENENRELNYLDITIKNTGDNQYKFQTYRKDAITNVQIKPHSCHDQGIKLSVFKGYIARAKSICSKEYINEEIIFLINVFVENGYNRAELENLVKHQNKPRKKSITNNPYVSLPWVPGVSQKLKRCFKKAGCNISFKSPKNLKSILTKRNKSKLPPNSYPGVYLIQCECRYRYTGQTDKRVVNREKQHQKNIFNGDEKASALAEHSLKCSCNVNWDNTKTLSIQPTYFKRCVREALEIQRHETGPNDAFGINKDYGQYVKTNIWKSLFPKTHNIVPRETNTVQTTSNI